LSLFILIPEGNKKSEILEGCDITLATPISKDTKDRSFMVTPLLEDQWLEEVPR